MSERERMITELTGRLCKVRVPVQYRQISRHSRLCRIVKVESAGEDDFYVTIKIENGEKGAGRRIRFFYTKAEMVALEKNSWGYVPATKATIERLRRRNTQDRTREALEHNAGHSQVS
jgi:hypothetical protein